MSDFQYCILPSGNAREFPELDAELQVRQVRSDYWELKNGGRIYRIHPGDLAKLPQDEQGPYLGTDNSGHSIYSMPDPAYNVHWAGNGWHAIYQPSEDTSNATQAS